MKRISLIILGIVFSFSLFLTSCSSEKDVTSEFNQFTEALMKENGNYNKAKFKLEQEKLKDGYVIMKGYISYISDEGKMRVVISPSFYGGYKGPEIASWFDFSDNLIAISELKQTEDIQIKGEFDYASQSSGDNKYNIYFNNPQIIIK